MSSTIDGPHLHEAPHAHETATPAPAHPAPAPHAPPHAGAPAHPHGHPPAAFEGRSDFAAAGAGGAHAVGGIAPKDLHAIEANVATYFKVWNHEPSADNPHRFDPRPAMELYTQTPHIHDLMLNFKALQHGQVTTDYRGDKSEYAHAMDKLYNSVDVFALKEVPGTRKLTQVNPNEIKLEVDFESKVKPKDPSLMLRILSPIAGGAMHALHERGVPLPGHASITFDRQQDGSWKIREEVLKPRIDLNPLHHL